MRTIPVMMDNLSYVLNERESLIVELTTNNHDKRTESEFKRAIKRIDKGIKQVSLEHYGSEQVLTEMFIDTQNSRLQKKLSKLLTSTHSIALEGLPMSNVTVGSYVKYKNSLYLVVRITGEMILLLSSSKGKVQVHQRNVELLGLDKAVQVQFPTLSGNYYLVEKDNRIISLTSHKVMKWDSNHGLRKGIILEADEVRSDILDFYAAAYEEWDDLSDALPDEYYQEQPWEAANEAAMS